MPKYYLSPDVYMCEIDDGAVLLDLKSHKYFGIDSRSLRELQWNLHGWRNHSHTKAADDADAAEEGDPDAIRELVAKGFLTPSEERGKRAAPIALRSADSIATLPRSLRKRPIDSRDMLRFFTSFSAACFYLKSARLKEVIQRLRTKKSTFAADITPSVHSRARTLVASFRHLSLWAYTRNDACLLDSVALTEYLYRYHIPSMLVIGIGTKPFSAHAWVQLDDVVLNDTVENVQLHVPILTV